ncbi:HD-GYP domain-containing protein [Roseibium sp.]|uniref:HD-GYP domain-containing protein n=1 Tax=Roseibium sp. TaxID=1936156 RepID=UPI003A970325
MKSLVYLTESQGAGSRVLQALNSLYVIEEISVAKVTADDLKESGFLLIDLAEMRESSLDRLRALLPFNPDTPSAALINVFKRQEVVQMKALGIPTFWDRGTSEETIIADIKKQFGSYGMPQLEPSVPEATAKAIEDVCQVYERLSIAYALGKPLPLKAAGNAIESVIGAINMDGLAAWLDAVEGHHSQTICHSLSVMGLVVQFSKMLALTDVERLLLGLGALYHDLGKLKIPLAVLDKPGALTPDERALINMHPKYGEEILEQHPEVPPVVRAMTLNHHEFLDGTGYPNGLSGDAISRPVRLLTICDIFSALSEKRSYKEPMSPRQAFGILWEMGDKLDRSLLSAFKDLILSVDVGAVKNQSYEAV